MRNRCLNLEGLWNTFAVSEAPAPPPKVSTRNQIGEITMTDSQKQEAYMDRLFKVNLIRTGSATLSLSLRLTGLCFCFLSGCQGRRR